MKIDRLDVTIWVPLLEVADGGGWRRKAMAEVQGARSSLSTILTAHRGRRRLRRGEKERAKAPGGTEETREGRGIEGGKMGSREMASGMGAPPWRREQGVKEEGNERDKPRVREPGWA